MFGFKILLSYVIDFFTVVYGKENFLNSKKSR